MTRKAKGLRRITLLSSGTRVEIDPSQWLQISGAKAFDETNTVILRVFKPRNQERYLVHGLRSSDWNPSTKRYDVFVEAYDVVAVAEALQPAIEAVAKHCGVEALVAKLVARGER